MSRLFPNGAPPAGRRIGLFGGSFNPAHDGHLHVSRLALRILSVDEVWWLVSPQNPLKEGRGMAPFAERLAAARDFAREPGIVVSDLEARLDTRYTADTIGALKRHAPGVRFVWMMGADNMATVHRWRDWHRIFTRVPVAVFDRAPYSLSCWASPAAIRFRRARLPRWRARDLALTAAPAWVCIAGSRHPGSATAVRRGEVPVGYAHAEIDGTRGKEQPHSTP